MTTLICLTLTAFFGYSIVKTGLALAGGSRVARVVVYLAAVASGFIVPYLAIDAALGLFADDAA